MKSVLSGLIGKRVKVIGGKKAPLNSEGRIIAVEHRGYNIMITAESETWDHVLKTVEMVDYHFELID